LEFIKELIPLSAPIFCAEPRHKRISTSIGARAPVSRRKKQRRWMVPEEKPVPKRNFVPLRLGEIRKIPTENQTLYLSAFTAK